MDHVTSMSCHDQFTLALNTNPRGRGEVWVWGKTDGLGAWAQIPLGTGDWYFFFRCFFRWKMTSTYTCIHTNIYPYIPIYIHTYQYICIHTCTQTHTHSLSLSLSLTYTHTHTHTHTQSRTLFPNAELNLLSPGSGCPLQAGTGHGRPGRAPGRC